MPEYDDPDISPFLEALDEAHEAQVRYDVARQLEAEGRTDVNTRQERVRFQQIVIGLFKRLRPYLKMRLDEYYQNAKVYDGPKGEIYGLKQLRHYQGAVEESAGFSGDEVYEQTEASLLPPMATRNALDLLGECMLLLGFAPSAREEESAYMLGEEESE
jgi:hypothetical protein